MNILMDSSLSELFVNFSLLAASEQTRDETEEAFNWVWFIYLEMKITKKKFKALLWFISFHISNVCMYVSEFDAIPLKDDEA